MTPEGGRKVTIDGVEYVPVGTFASGDELAKAVIRALVSGYYSSMRCNKDGGGPRTDCDCSECRIRQVAVQVLNGEPLCKSEPLIEKLWCPADIIPVQGP